MSNPNYKCEDGKIKLNINNSWIEPSFEQYENIESLGEPGANGVVIKGTHKITRRDEAIKIWLPRNRDGKNEVRVKQYLAEVQKIAKLNDPRIVTVYDAWEENGLYCCSMELVNGITYKEWLKRKDVSQKVNMLLKIFEAIIFYQSQGIIHGDIHSKNIMIDGNEKIHIIDFGTSYFSSYKEKSYHRENSLMYELVEQTLKEEFDNEAFLCKKYKPQEDIGESIYILDAIPILFSKSILSYLNLKIMLDNVPDIVNQPRDIYQYCRYIATGLYLYMDYYYSRLSGENKRKLEKFSSIMFESLEDEVFGNAQNNSNEYERMNYISLFVYYEEVKKGLLAEKIEESLVGKYIKNSRFCNIIAKANDLFELHNILLEMEDDCMDVYFIETKLRTSFFEILEENYNAYFLHFLRYMNLRIEELKMQNELCEKIVRLSYLYCINNEVIYPSSVEGEMSS